MASIGRLRGGYKSLLWYDSDKRRKHIRLGKCNIETARQIKARVEEVLASQRAGTTLPLATAQWLSDVEDDFYDKLARNGLCEPRECREPTSLESVVDTFIARRTGVERGTLLTYRQTRTKLLEYFTGMKDVDEITAGDAKDFRDWLLQDGYAESSTGRRITQAKTIFEDLVDRETIGKNPFRKVPSGGKPDDGRREYLPRENIQKVIDACPSARWRLIVALCRYAGLRCPSEVACLTWDDILWEQRKIIIRSPKNKRHHNAKRIIPLFPELEPHLSDVFEQAKEGTKHVITGLTSQATPHFMAIIQKSGVPAWPKPFTNMRASCQTDLAATYPPHVVAEWAGNSVVIGRKHYLQAVDADFDKAVGGGKDGQPLTDSTNLPH